MKEVKGYEQEAHVYYSDSGQMMVEKNRTKNRSKGLHAVFSNSFQALKEAYT